jgi:ATP-binding cassette, subfamily C, bacterial PrsD
VLYDGKLIAFGPSAEVFARVKAANGKKEPAPSLAKAEPRPALAESVPS